MPASPLPADKNGTPAKKKGAPDSDNNMNGADFGKAIGISKPANVRDKIKKWQQAVEPDVPEVAAETKPAAEPAVEPVAEPAVEPAAEPAPEPAATPVPKPKPPTTPKTRAIDDKPNWKPAHTSRKSVDVSPERPISAKKTPVAHNPLDDDLLTATAPKKRVISDSHWRQKQSPPKEANRPAPKTIPNAWVRPSKIVKKPAGIVPEEIKPPPPSTPPLKPLLPLVNYVGMSTGQKKPPQRQRRPSKPASVEGDLRRPVSSGSGSKDEVKSEDNAVALTSTQPEKEPTEIVKVRRRRRARTSPRGSLSAEETNPYTHRPARKSETSLSEDPENVVTVHYEESHITSPRDDELRERRRRRRPRSQGDRTAEQSPRNAPNPSPNPARRRSRRSFPRSDNEDVAVPPLEPVAVETPPTKVFGNRLEAWLSGTPDPFVEAESRRRCKSKESISTLELPAKEAQSDVTTSTDTQDESVETPRRHSSGSGSKRRRRRRSREMHIDTQIVDEAPSTVISDVTTETSVQETESELSLTSTTLTPTPTLKRRGAKRSQHSPTKSRSMSSPLRETTGVDDPHDDASSVVSSSVDASAIDIENIPLRPRPLSIQRGFPSKGKRLSTIVSVDSYAAKTQGTLSDITESEILSTLHEDTRTVSGVTASDLGSQLNPETSTIVSRRSTRRKRLASHADLISVLSMPKAGAKSIMSARSIRTNRSRLATATIGDVLKELASDEAKYMRELRTLVDGVIPVLLSCVLSKSDSAVAAGLFSRSANTDPSDVTKPIVSMGVELERLKTLHKRIPKDDSDAFISWAQSAQRVYSDYIAAWCLGFQDVVISLAPADDDPFKPAKIVTGPEDGAPWDEGMPRNADGYVVNGDGERVDVAYMLKRPLVRLKYLAKSLKVCCSSQYRSHMY